MIERRRPPSPDGARASSFSFSLSLRALFDAFFLFFLTNATDTASFLLFPALFYLSAYLLLGLDGVAVSAEQRTDRSRDKEGGDVAALVAVVFPSFFVDVGGKERVSKKEKKTFLLMTFLSFALSFSLFTRTKTKQNRDETSD